MVTSKGDTGEQLEINVNDIKLEQVNQYTYLGSLITEDGRCLREVKKRIAQAKEAFWKNRELLRGNVNIEDILSSQYVLIFKTQLFKKANTRQTNINLIETRKDPERVQQSGRKQSLHSSPQTCCLGFRSVSRRWPSTTTWPSDGRPNARMEEVMYSVFAIQMRGLETID